MAGGIGASEAQGERQTMVLLVAMAAVSPQEIRDFQKDLADQRKDGGGIALSVEAHDGMRPEDLQGMVSDLGRQLVRQIREQGWPKAEG